MIFQIPLLSSMEKTLSFTLCSGAQMSASTPLPPAPLGAKVGDRGAPPGSPAFDRIDCQSRSPTAFGRDPEA